MCVCVCVCVLFVIPFLALMPLVPLRSQVLPCYYHVLKGERGNELAEEQTEEEQTNPKKLTKENEYKVHAN